MLSTRLLLLTGLCAACIFGLTGCTLRGDIVHGIEVPFIPQKPNECGVATLQMAFERQSIPYDPETLRKRVYLPALKGTTIGVMAQSARELGARATIGVADNHLLANWLEFGLCPIVLWGPDAPGSVGHFLIVTGISKSHTAFRVHSGPLENQWVSYDSFMKRWRSGGYRVLLIEHPDNPPPPEVLDNTLPVVGSRPIDP